MPNCLTPSPLASGFLASTDSLLTSPSLPLSPASWGVKWQIASRLPRLARRDHSPTNEATTRFQIVRKGGRRPGNASPTMSRWSTFLHDAYFFKGTSRLAWNILIPWELFVLPVLTSPTQVHPGEVDPCELYHWLDINLNLQLFYVLVFSAFII